VKVESITDDGRIQFDKLAHIDEQTNELIARSVLEEDDILFTIAGTIGRAALVHRSLLPANTNQAVAIVRPDLNRVYPRFLYYTLKDKDRVQQAHTRVVQSVQANFSLAELSALEIFLPELSEQRAIAHILGTLDDKIELNRRMNETLESIARALFQSWFVDFDPVRAKAEGRDPGLPKPIADLFPDSFEESELGEIPKGWETKGLDEIARFLNGLAMQKFPPTGGRSLPVIKIAELRAGSTRGADRASADLDPDYVVQDGDVLFSWSGSLECVIWAGGTGALNQHLFKVTSSQVPKWFHYLSIHRHLQDFRHIAAGKATTMGHIQRHHLSDARVAVPPAPLMEYAERSIGVVLDLGLKRRIESCALSTARDTLLPKLISGELRVSGVERSTSVRS
jgi:type I restriction enzyme S subunit